MNSLSNIKIFNTNIKVAIKIKRFFRVGSVLEQFLPLGNLTLSVTHKNDLHVFNGQLKKLLKLSNASVLCSKNKEIFVAGILLDFDSVNKKIQHFG